MESTFIARITLPDDRLNQQIVKRSQQAARGMKSLGGVEARRFHGLPPHDEMPM
jgi:hypothetical protein